MFGGFAAFAGIDGDMLEMLFVAPKARGKGVGRQLVEYLVRERGIRQVDVNEQNAQAAGFYARLGFRVTGRDATDPSGRPYPILHLSLGETQQPKEAYAETPGIITRRQSENLCRLVVLETYRLAPGLGTRPASGRYSI